MHVGLEQGLEQAVFAFFSFSISAIKKDEFCSKPSGYNSAKK